MDVKLKIELSNGGRVVSLDEFTKTFLEGVQRVVRQEFQRLQIPHAPEEPSPAVPEAKRALAVSIMEAARILGVSRRTTAAEYSCPFGVWR